MSCFLWGGHVLCPLDSFPLSPPLDIQDVQESAGAYYCYYHKRLDDGQQYFILTFKVEDYSLMHGTNTLWLMWPEWAQFQLVHFKIQSLILYLQCFVIFSAIDLSRLINNAFNDVYEARKFMKIPLLNYISEKRKVRPASTSIY